jgi:hypothetical protein
VFGRDDRDDTDGWAGGRVSESGQYAWVLWRPYACCEIKGVFLYDLDVVPFP